jgi:hypothetical protein
MQPNWNYVKKTTLWQYEDLIKKLNSIKAYPTLWQAYNLDMTQAAILARRTFPEANLEAGEFPGGVLSTIARLKSAGIKDWGDLLSKVPSRADCAAFVNEHNLNFEEFIDLFNYLLRWGFPFQTASREILDHDNSQEMSNYRALKQHKLMNSFDILERGHTREGRSNLAELTGLSPNFVTCLVHRADIVRLPYVRRKTLIPLYGAGYSTLAKIATGDLAQMDHALKTYYWRVQGKSWENYKSVIVLKLLVTCAQALPVIMEE